jgi:hypothetical protein
MSFKKTGLEMWRINLIFFQANFNLSVRNYEAKDFYGWHPEDALRVIHYHLVCLEIPEEFLKITDGVIVFSD